MSTSINLRVPNTNIYLIPGMRVRLGRFEHDSWVTNFGWYAYAGNRPVLGWYLAKYDDTGFIKPLQYIDLDDIEVIETLQFNETQPNSDQMLSDIINMLNTKYGQDVPQDVSTLELFRVLESLGKDGFSPIIEVESVIFSDDRTGYKISITDKDGPKPPIYLYNGVDGKDASVVTADKYMTEVDDDGKLRAQIMNELDYSGLSDNAFISKGTLDGQLDPMKSRLVDAIKDPMHFRGAVLTKEDLPSNPKIGDVWYVQSRMSLYIYLKDKLDLSRWMWFGPPIEVLDYSTLYIDDIMTSPGIYYLRAESIEMRHGSKHLDISKPSLLFLNQDMDTCQVYSPSGQYTFHISDDEWDDTTVNADIIRELLYSQLWEAGTGESSTQTKGTDCSAEGDFSVAEGLTSQAVGFAAHAEGGETVASADYSHAEGEKSKTGDEVISPETIPAEDQVNTTLGSAHAEGFATLARPMSSHAEGYKTQAIGFASHSEGNSTQAKGINSHAEGASSETTLPTGSGAISEWRDGYAAHAEGHLTTAGGRASHTEGNNTVTNNPSEHAEGQYNVSHYEDGSSYGDSGNTQHSIGIGTNLSNRKNAWEIMQNGDAYLIGVGEYDGTNPKESKTVQSILLDLPDKLTASDNIIIDGNNAVKTKDSQLVTVDCSSLSTYTVEDEKIYVLTNPSTLEISVSGNSERHFFVVCGSTAPIITIPSAWGEIAFDANKTIEISVLNGKAVYKIW